MGRRLNAFRGDASTKRAANLDDRRYKVQRSFEVDDRRDQLPVAQPVDVPGLDCARLVEIDGFEKFKRKASSRKLQLSNPVDQVCAPQALLRNVDGNPANNVAGVFATTYDYPNLTNAAEAFESIVVSQVSALNFLNGLNGLSNDDLALAILQASGKIHAFSLAGVNQATGIMSGAALGRLSSLPEGQRIWTDVSGVRTDHDGEAIPSMYETDHRYAWVGVDLIQTDAMRAGAALGYVAGNVDAGVSGEADYEGINAAVYYQHDFGNLKLSTIAGLGRANIDTDRNTSLSTGTTVNTPEGRADVAFAEARLGYDQVFSERLNGTVRSSVQIDTARAKTVVEDGPAVTALTAHSETETSTTISAGYAEWWVGSPEADSISPFVSEGLQMRLNEISFLELSARASRGDDWESYGASLNFSTRW